MSQSNTPNIQALSTEVSQLRQELQLRDQLVQQLSQELFRLVKGNTNFMPQQSDLERDITQLQALQEQLQAVEEQVGFYQEQISTRDSEIYQLRQSVQELTDRSRMLEQVVQELPQIYRRKFEERMTPVREKVAILQRENRQLQAELQSVSYRLAIKTRNSSHSGIDLPNFPRTVSEQTQISTPQNA
ncbi:Npun_F5560 family protein [Nostoc sp. PA-18-2419]|uniref:Npun_F5560 family protein n=1 Tax=Nostoc sp. PA-18-2419 TaxID=2575443 RepID=UPI001107E3D7|nr:Npun_F5560 family protein [Nostoc sp. PA-18-2419]